MARHRYSAPKQSTVEKTRPLGYPSLDVTGKVPAAQLPVTGGGAPATADFLVKTADAGLSAERVVTDTATVTWDWATPGQAKANAAGGGGAPTTADYLVKTADAGLSAERVVTDTASVAVDWATAGQAKFNVQFGTSGTTATVGNDARLSDARTPTLHHGNHELSGSDEINVTGLAGVLLAAQKPQLGTSGTVAAAGNDARLSDARTPTSHVIATNAALGAEHTISGASAGQVLRASSATAANFQALAVADLPAALITDTELAALDYIDTTEFNARSILTTAPLTGGGNLSADRTIAISDATTTTKGAVELATDGESAANVVVQGNDSRMSNARTPTAHATTHKSGGSDAIKLDELAAPTDITTLNASAIAHGLLPKWPNNTTTFLRGDGTYAAPTAALGLTTTEVSLGSTAHRSGRVQITGLSGLTIGKAVLVNQAVGPYTGKGTRADETEMDSLSLAGKVLNTTTIDVYWTSQYQVRGNYKLDYLVAA